MKAERPRSDALVFFGASGDLAYKKVFPALQRLARRGKLDVPVVGVARSGLTRDQLVERARASVTEIYEPRWNGVEQLFRIDELPEGASGDLTLSGRFTTSLDVRWDSGRGGVSFLEGEEEVLTYGAATVIERGGAPGTIQLAPWLPAPTAVTATGNTFSFSTVGPDAIRYATFERGTTRLWTVTILDRSSSFTLPTIAPDPLGTGTIELEITAADVGPYSASDFRVTDFTSALARAAGATTTFTR